MIRLMRTLRRAPALCAAGAVVCGFAIAHKQRERKRSAVGTIDELSAVLLATRQFVTPPRRVAHCNVHDYPSVCVVTEIPQGSAIYLTGHGDQDINQAESGAEPFIFKFTRGHIPKTRISRDEPLFAIVLGHLESVPGWVLKDAKVVGELVVCDHETGVPLSKELLVVAKEASVTREQIEDLMVEAASCLETLKSEYELGTKVYVKPAFDPVAAERTLSAAKLEYKKQEDHDYKVSLAKKHSKTVGEMRRESKQAKELLEDMPLSEVPLSSLFDELARRGINGEPGRDMEGRHAPATNPR